MLSFCNCLSDTNKLCTIFLISLRLSLITLTEITITGLILDLFTHFYKDKSQKRKKDWLLECICVLLGSAQVKAAYKMLVKLTPSNLTITRTQYQLSKKLVLMPHSAFSHLIKNVDVDVDRKCPELIFLTHTGKSGSNLICDIFKLLPNTE